MGYYYSVSSFVLPIRRVSSHEQFEIVSEGRRAGGERRDEGRDAHLKVSDFFNADQFPTMSLKWIRITRYPDGDLVVLEDLTSLGWIGKIAFSSISGTWYELLTSEAQNSSSGVLAFAIVVPHRQWA